MHTPSTNRYSVAKFGGTSVANYEAMVRCVNVILNSPDVRIIVVSAPSGVTSLLVKLCQEENPQRTTILSEITKKINAILAALPPTVMPHLQKDIQLMQQELQQLADKLEQEKNLALADEIISFGERFSARLFTCVLNQMGLPALYQDAREWIKTDDCFGKAVVLLDETKRQVSAVLSQDSETLRVTEGFIGSTLQNQTTTLGRGGSDYSAALLAEAINAKDLYIWTDVPGIYTVDPGVVQSARPLLNLSFIEAAELATFGAKVLHPATLWPAIRENIPVYVGSSMRPEAGGTWIRNHYPTDGEIPAISAIALRRRQTLLTINSLEMLHAHGFLAKIFTVLALHELSVDLVTTSEVSVALTFNSVDSGTLSGELITEAVLKDLQAIGNISLKIDKDLCLIALVGNELHLTPGISGAVFHILESFNVRLICHGASPHNLCFLVSEQDANNVVKKLHAEFFEKAQVSM